MESTTEIAELLLTTLLPLSVTELIPNTEITGLLETHGEKAGEKVDTLELQEKKALLMLNAESINTLNKDPDAKEDQLKLLYAVCAESTLILHTSTEEVFNKL